MVHVEPSMDAHTWAKREERYTKKFGAGINLPTEIEQIALLGFASNGNLIPGFQLDFGPKAGAPEFMVAFLTP